MDLLKQFSKDDLMEVLRHIVGDFQSPNFAESLLNDLHITKYKRLVEQHNKKIDEYEKKYKKYQDKSVPQRLVKEFNKFVLAFQKSEGDVRAQREILKQRNLFKKEDK